MKILKNEANPKAGDAYMKLEVTCKEDAYVLSDIIRPGDVVESFTTRKLSQDGGRTQQKITLVLALKVERVDADLDAGMLDIKGQVSRENEHVRQGSYHTHHIAIGDNFKLYKQNWQKREINRLKDASKEEQTICIAIFYEKECVISTVSSVGINSIYREEIKNKNYKMAINAVIKLKNSIQSLLIAGFSDSRNEFCKLVAKECPDIQNHIAVVKLSAAYKGLPSSKAINKMLVDKEFASKFSEVRYVDDLREAEQFLKDALLKSNKVGLGMSEVREAIEYGAVKKLFITDQFYRPSTRIERKVIDKLIEQIKELRAKVYVLPVSHEFGVKLKEYGNIGCTLLFDYK